MRVRCGAGRLHQPRREAEAPVQFSRRSVFHGWETLAVPAEQCRVIAPAHGQR